MLSNVVKSFSLDTPIALFICSIKDIPIAVHIHEYRYTLSNKHLTILLYIERMIYSFIAISMSFSCLRKLFNNDWIRICRYCQCILKTTSLRKKLIGSSCHFYFATRFIKCIVVTWFIWQIGTMRQHNKCQYSLLKVIITFFSGNICPWLFLNESENLVSCLSSSHNSEERKKE